MRIATSFNAIFLFAPRTLAQTPINTGSAAAETGDLRDLVNDLPQCALPCLTSAAVSIGCKASDLTCLCSKPSQFVASIGPCILVSRDCTSGEKSDISSLASDICSDINSSDPAELASASALINAALATATSVSAPATASGPPSSGGVGGIAAARANSFGSVLGAMGAVAALAVLAL